MYPSTNRYVGFLYLAPALAFVAFMVFYPLAQVILVSLTDESLLGGGNFIGLENYTDAFSDKKFWQALWFTVKYTIIITPLLMGFGFLVALLVAPNTKLRQTTRGIVFLPVVIGMASSSLLWFWLFDQQVGLFNKLLVDLGILDEPMVWFRKANFALWAVVISVTWKMLGFGMILIVSGMQAVSHDVVEASMIDGCSYWRRVRRIIFPLTARTIVLATLISAIGSMLAFEQFYLMTSGGPRGQTFTSVYLIYQNSFVKFDMGYGSALSVILMVIILCGTTLQILLSSRGKK